MKRLKRLCRELNKKYTLKKAQEALILGAKATRYHDWQPYYWEIPKTGGNK